MNTIIYSLTLSLLDSLSTTQQIIIFILMLATDNPLKNSIAYFAGLSGAYIACGIAGYFVIEQLQTFINECFPSTVNVPNAVYYQSEFISGIIMIIIGVWYFSKKKHTPAGRSANIIISKLRSMNALLSFSIGVFISVSSFPVAVPYIIALGKYTALHLEIPAAIGNILIYNIGYALPMIMIMILYLYARRGTDDLSDALHEKARRLNVRLTTWAFAGFGIFSMIDALWYFVMGHGLIKGRYI